MKLKFHVALAVITATLGLAISTTAQTNEPVVQIKPYHAANYTNQINLGIRSAPFNLRGQVEAVYSTRFLLELNEPESENGKEIIIQNYPRMESLAIGQRLAFVAQKIGTIRGAMEDGAPAGGEVLELWEYYIPPPPPPPPTPEQIVAAKAKVAADKKAGEEKGLKYNQELAAKGDPYGLLRMGERYRDGDGVPKDLAKARDCFTKAVAAGSPSAADELSGLDRSTNAATTKQ